MVAFCRAELGRIESFCRERDVIGLVDEPLEIEWTPEFMRSFGGAMLDSPGPLDVGQKTFFSITPPRAEWAPDEVESYLREMNARQLQLLTIHECRATTSRWRMRIGAARRPGASSGPGCSRKDGRSTSPR